jgi:hypothetical protein
VSARTPAAASASANASRQVAWPLRAKAKGDCYAAQCCPVLEVFGQTYHWSLMQVEFAADLVFRSAATLGPLHEQLTRC